MKKLRTRETLVYTGGIIIFAILCFPWLIVSLLDAISDSDETGSSSTMLQLKDFERA